jgi:hypothetical protein
LRHCSPITGKKPWLRAIQFRAGFACGVFLRPNETKETKEFLPAGVFRHKGLADALKRLYPKSTYIEIRTFSLVALGVFDNLSLKSAYKSQ